MTSEQEKIVCAAVRKWAGSKESVELFVDYPPKYLTGDAQIGHVGYQKGFITNKNRFVDPVEAMGIHLNTIMQLEKPFIELGDTGRRMLGIESIDQWDRIKEFYSRDHLKPEDLY